MAAFGSVLDVIGGTPSVWLDRLVADAGVDGRILAKLDYLNPGFSKKDRAALGIIEAAQAAGELVPGQCVVELTSGNMGTGLAIVCGVLGYPFVAVMSRGNSPERAQMMRALGAEVILVDQAAGSVVGAVSGEDLALVEVEAKRVTHARGAFRADQFNHVGNMQAHLHGTGPELWADSGESLTAFVDFVGSGGTFAGTARALRDASSDVQCYVAEPDGASVLAGHDVVQPGHPIQGGGYSMADLAALNGVTPNGFIAVPADAARDIARRLARIEGIFAGYSAGANVWSALQLLQGAQKGGTIGVVICDSGLKYLSTDLWAE